jgi:nucleotide-binding universal stress UspA family protein
LAELADLDEKRNRLALEHGKQLLEAAKQKAQKICKQNIETLQRHGELADTLIEFADQIRILVIGRLGENSQSHLSKIGAQVENIVRSVKRPVMVANQEIIDPKNVLIAYDASAVSQRLLSLAAASPLMEQKTCHIVMVGDHGEQHLEDAASLMKKAGHDVKTAHLEGEVDDALMRYAHDQQIDLLVMGAYGHSRVRQFLIGSNTTKILYKSDRSLLFLR